MNYFTFLNTKNRHVSPLKSTGSTVEEAWNRVSDDKKRTIPQDENGMPHEYDMFQTVTKYVVRQISSHIVGTTNGSWNDETESLRVNDSVNMTLAIDNTYYDTIEEASFGAYVAMSEGDYYEGDIFEVSPVTVVKLVKQVRI